MGQRGPKPVHPAFKQLANSTRPKAGARFKPCAPVCPAWLSATARKVFRSVVKELEAAGAVAAVDVELVAAYASTTTDLATVSKAIDLGGVVVQVQTVDRNGRPTGHTVARPNPLLKTKDALTGRMKQLADALGIGHAARQRQGSAPADAPRTENKVVAIRDRIQAARSTFG